MTVFATARSLIIALAGFAIGLLLAAMALPLAARAEPPAANAAATANPIATADASETKTINIVVYGNDACPTGKGDEIVVCAREPESERYRIPKRFRGKKVQAAPGNSWNNKVRSTEDASRMAAGLPDTCSAVGSGGQTGCFQHFQTQARLQRQQQKEEAANPGGVPQY
ncbi:MAG TPA: hypothetical protein VKQ09_05515 [Sphingomonas sp.]|nr:hypothetical protein [Sphingomonas sp.]